MKAPTEQATPEKIVRHDYQLLNGQQTERAAP